MATTSLLSNYNSLSYPRIPHYETKQIGRPLAFPIVKPNIRLLPSLAKRSLQTVSPNNAFKNPDALATDKLDIVEESSLSVKDFPPDFLFGAGSSSYQVEGGYKDGGKGPSVWDVFTNERPEKILDGSNGNVACNSYHKYKEDVKMVKAAGLNVYRFSICWPRILPTGSLKGGINMEGLRYYNNLINELLENGITPFVTLFHWEVPQALELEYGGFLSRRIIDDYKDFARICFENFGDRVKNWATLNEPFVFTYYGYNHGVSPPGRCSPELECEAGNSATEPYIVSHHMILAHATAVKLYREEFKEQKGQIGITINTDWMFPFDDTKQHAEAVDRSLDFHLGWHLEPLVHGDYPFIMKALVKERLPQFTEEEKSLIVGSFDYIGINYYESQFVYSLPFSPDNRPHSFTQDTHVEFKEKPELHLRNARMGDAGFVSTLGLKELLLYTHRKYNSPPIYITETGIVVDDVQDDQLRIKFYTDVLTEIKDAIKCGVNVKGLFAWSLLDSFEWVKGYTIRLGLSFVDQNDPDLKRKPKASLQWFNDFINSK